MPIPASWPHPPSCLLLTLLLGLTAKPSPPVVSGPTERAAPEQTVSFTCQSHGFSPRNITLKWFKNGNELPASQTTVDPEGDSASYRISSTAEVVLAPGDVRSQVICEVAHVTLQGGPPLRGTANLSETLRVPPSLEVSQHPVAGNQVNVTCQVKNFYPRRLQLSWLENGNMSRTETASNLTENKDGTFNWTSWLLVNVTAHREDVVLTCQVEHDGQPAVTTTQTVHISAHKQDKDTGQIPGPEPPTRLLVALLLGHKVLLTVGVSAIYLLPAPPAARCPPCLLPPSCPEGPSQRQGAVRSFHRFSSQCHPPGRPASLSSCSFSESLMPQSCVFIYGPAWGP
ncbi:hypothetical protein MC885_021766 [Smutsia gigantea]|nr:hypothetical protein MC885_021766 [Smutsia gigantea]